MYSSVPFCFLFLGREGRRFERGGGRGRGKGFIGVAWGYLGREGYVSVCLPGEWGGAVRGMQGSRECIGGGGEVKSRGRKGREGGRFGHRTGSLYNDYEVFYQVSIVVFREIFR